MIRKAKSFIKKYAKDIGIDSQTAQEPDTPTPHPPFKRATLNMFDFDEENVNTNRNNDQLTIQDEYSKY